MVYLCLAICKRHCRPPPTAAHLTAFSLISTRAKMLWETRLPTAGMSQCCYHVTLWTDPRLQSDAKGHFSRYHRFFSGSLLFSASAVYLYLYNQTILIFRCFVQEARVAMHLCEVAVCVFARVGLCVNHWCRAAPPPLSCHSMQPYHLISPPLCPPSPLCPHAKLLPFILHTLSHSSHLCISGLFSFFFYHFTQLQNSSHLWSYPSQMW